MSDTGKAEFYELDRLEESEVLALISRIHSLTDMAAVLGMPDKVIEMRVDDEPRIVRVTKYHQYFKRWRTICLNFNEMTDGSYEVIFHGKQKDVG